MTWRDCRDEGKRCDGPGIASRLAVVRFMVAGRCPHPAVIARPRLGGEGGEVARCIAHAPEAIGEIMRARLASNAPLGVELPATTETGAAGATDKG